MRPASAILAPVAHEWWMRLLTVVMRLVMGGMFIFSGFVKAIDPWGSYYKFNEYFAALGLGWLQAASLVAGFALAAFELLLGVALALGLYRRAAPTLATLLMLVMTPLTLWLALTDAVPDCGCFGDAWVLSNWATFGKNVLLLLGALWLFFASRHLPSVYGNAVHWIVMVLTFFTAAMLAVNGYFYQPLLDFRPYPVGTRLVSSTPVGDENDFEFVYERNGVREQFAIDSLPDEEDGWTYVERIAVNRQATTLRDSIPQAAIAIFENGADITDLLIDPEGRQLLLLFPDITKVSIANSFAINELSDKADQEGVRTYGLTSGTIDQIKLWNDISMASYPTYIMDDGELKMLARGNPAVVYVDGGVIQWKRVMGSIRPTAIEKATSLSDLVTRDDEEVLTNILSFFALAMVVLLLFNRTHVLLLNLWRRLRRHHHNDIEQQD